MILEIARLLVIPGSEAEFEAALPRAVEFFRTARGCLGMEIFRSVDTGASYRLVVRWETLENHVVDFRGSENFPKWRGLITPFLAGPIEVENTTPIGVGF
jgi:heme-degrading monooxygenase HmoA